jgi:hypothetical protein
MKDFSVDRKPDLEFKIGDDVFYAVGDSPGGVILDLAAMANSKEGEDKVGAISEFLDGVLLPESAELFADRMRNPSNPITFPQLLAVFEWLLEDYTGGVEAGRPTREAASSSSGSRRTGRNSTGSVRSRVSTPVTVASDAL